MNLQIQNIMILVKDNEVYKCERKEQFTLEEIITFKIPKIKVYEKPSYDWYMSVALEKSDKVKNDRHLLTSELLLQYRWAIREGYNHQLDSALKNKYDHPKNQNTLDGIHVYINRIKKASQEEMKAMGIDD